MKKISLVFATLFLLVAFGGRVQAQCTDGSYNCYLVFNMYDGYGDGWNGNTLTVVQGGTTLATLTISGSEGTDTLRICTANGPIQISYNPVGSYQYENSFTVVDSLGSELYSGEGNYDGFSFTVAPCPTCPSPGSLTASSITSSSATVSWTETGSATTWYYRYGTSPVPMGAWQQASSTTVDLADLASNTVYYFFVYSDCGEGDTSAVASFSFRTECGQMSLPINEGFENNGSEMPFCWKTWEWISYNPYGYYAENYPQVSEGSYYYAYGHNSPNSLALYPIGGNVSVMSPKMPVLANQLEVILWMAGPDEVQVGYVTTNDSASAVFHLVGTVGPTTYGTGSYPVYYSWEQYTVPFDTVSTTDSIWIVIRCAESLSDDVTYIDDITIRQMVNCPQATDLVESGTPATGQVTLSWNDPVGSQWQVVYGPVGFDPDMATSFVTSATTSVAVTGLDDEETYDFYVRSVCGNVSGYWSNVVTAQPNVYRVSAQQMVDTIISCGINVMSDGGLEATCTPGMTQTLVLLPTEEDNTVRIRGYAHFYSGFSSYYPNKMRIFAGTDTTGVLLADISSQNVNNIDITSEVGAMTIWYSVTDDDYYAAEGFKFYVSCEEMASCTTPYGLTVSNITGTEALVSWQYNTALGEASGFTLYVTEAGSDSPTSYEIAGSDRSFQLTGLNERTAYQLRLALDCEGIDTIGTSFATVCSVGGDVQIGEGTTTDSYLPTYLLYGNTLSQQLFTAVELEGVSTIFGFRFYQTSSTQNDRLVEIYMDTTSLPFYTLTDDYVIPDSADRYFSGHVHFSQGWVEVTFDSAFTVPAGKNVVLTFNDHTNSWTSSTSNRITNTADNMAIYRYRDGSPFDPTDSSTFGGTSTICSFRNTIAFLTPCANTSCVPPTITSVEADTHSVTLNWTVGNDESSWKVEYRVADSSTWTEWQASTGETTSTVTGLLAATGYVFRVSSLCSDTTVGRVATATTLCGEQSLPFFEGFEQFTAYSGSPETQMCWYRGSNSSYTYSYYPYISSYEAFEGSRSLYLYNYGSYLVLPKMALPVDTLSIGFHAMYESSYYGSPQVQIGVCTNPEDTNTFNVIRTLTLDVDTYVWTEMGADLDGYAGPDGHLFIRNAASDYGAAINIDNLTVDVIPACRRLAGAMMDNITSSSISLTISDEYAHDSYTIYWNLRDSLQDAIDSITVTTLTATITGLLSDTTYHVWVRGNCGGEHGAFYYMGTFHTLCSSIAIGNDDEYFNDFESGEFDCIWQISDASKKLWTNAMSEPYSSLNPYSGSRMAHFANSTDCETMLILPTFDFTGMTVGNAELSFYQLIDQYQTYDYSTGGYIVAPPSTLKVYYRTSESGPWTLLAAVDSTVLGSWKKYFVELTASQGAAVYQVALKGRTNANSYGVNLDDLKVKCFSLCRTPENVTVSNITERTATVRWTGSAPSYKVQYRPDYQWSWNARIVEDNDSVVISPLEMASNYEVRVIGLCSAYDQTEPSEVVRFVTEFCEDRTERNNYAATALDTIAVNGFGDPTHSYSYTEILVDAASLAGMSNINGFSFYVDSLPNTALYGNCQVYFGHTTQTALSSFQYDSTFVMVYEGSLSYTALGEHRVTLTAPFQWDGSRNLVVAVMSSNGYSSLNSYLGGHKAAVNKVYQGYKTSSFPPAQANMLSAGNKTASNAVPDLTFYGCNPVCFEPVVSRVSTTADEITVEWYNENATVQLEIKESASNEWNIPVLVSGAYRYTFTGLASVTNYDIRLRRECDVEAMLYSDYVELNATTDTLCSTPEELTVSEITAHSATFSWTDGEVIGGKWQLHVWNDETNIYRDVTTNPATIDGLIAGATYHAAVRSYCCVDDHVAGEFSDPVTFDNICYPATGVEASVNGHNVTLSWTAGERNSRWIVCYGYRGFEPNQQLGYVEATSPSVTIENLDPGFTYAFRVRAICADDWNSAWNETEVTAHVQDIDEADGNGTRFVLQPNPATSRVTLVLSGAADEAEVSIYGIDGRQVSQFTAYGDRVDVALDGYAAGTYFVRVQTVDWTSVRKLVVK